MPHLPTEPDTIEKTLSIEVNRNEPHVSKLILISTIFCYENMVQGISFDEPDTKGVREHARDMLSRGENNLLHQHKTAHR